MNKKDKELEIIESEIVQKVTKEDVEELFEKHEALRVNQVERDLCETFSVDKPAYVVGNKMPKSTEEIPPSNIDQLREIGQQKIDENGHPSIEITSDDTGSTEEAVSVAEAIEKKNSKNE